VAADSLAGPCLRLLTAPPAAACPPAPHTPLLAQRHAGARIAGEWSRFDLMTRPAEFARTAIPGLAASLPPSARALYYRDAIGNISSSGGLCSLGCWLAECGGKCF
jgi:hypothetical protein